MTKDEYKKLRDELNRLMDSPEVLRYHQCLNLIKKEEEKIKIPAPTLAEYMKFQRQKLGMNQKEYAKHLGWDKIAVSQIESGSQCNIKRARKLFAEGYSAKVLLGDKNKRDMTADMTQSNNRSNTINKQKPESKDHSKLVALALTKTHENTCNLIEKLPIWCYKSRKKLIKELIQITCAIDDILTEDNPNA